MIKLQVNGVVLSTMRLLLNDKKKDKALGYLTKYVSTLELELNKSVARGLSVLAWRFKCYDLALSPLHNVGGQISPLGGIRVHKWLLINGLNLIDDKPNIRKANNFTKEISLVKFTKLVKLVEQNCLANLRKMTASQFNHFLNTPSPDDIALYQPIIDEANNLSKKQRLIDYDVVEIDVHSLENYIRMIVAGQYNLTPLQEETNARQAISILRIAQLNNNLLPQKKKRSEFGRIYYEGHSVQSVHKTLRKAMLGTSFEYDAKSCAPNWKYAFAQDYLNSINSIASVGDEFYGTEHYLFYKKEFYKQVIADTFDSESTWSEDKKTEKIKETMTSLSFGAKMVEATWTSSNGVQKQTSIMDIFKFPDERQRFLKSPSVVRFKLEQQVLDNYISETFRNKYPDIDSLKILKSQSGRRSQPKVIAWLYQHAETHMMNIVRDELRKLGKTLLANVHDAVVIREQLTQDEIKVIENEVRYRTAVTNFSLGETPYP
ncbi:hypothetical protein B9Z35_12780 [Limnohabitans sp. Jir61]|uniref:hypothetical protein n=1 Tax=Limnohabitans sp. Jir61 TaxID=1826168 RepID=UPI000D38F7EB|nr:hypothetical protein [Limnohabitans sp. Jir61]PUE28055.1 hypothetical protein B9Z35_12780 [Limnohabitans sp. Jir61]